MLHLSNTERIQAKSVALRVLTANANLLVWGDRSASKADKEAALSALTEIEWAPDLARSVGPRNLNRLLARIRNDEFPHEEYLILADMIAHSADEAVPLEHPQWALWEGLIARYHLFEMAPTSDRATLVAKLDTRGIRSPADLTRLLFEDLSNSDWGLPHPDMMVWLWHGGSSGFNGAPPSSSSLYSGSGLGFPGFDSPPP